MKLPAKAQLLLQAEHQLTTSSQQLLSAFEVYLFSYPYSFRLFSYFTLTSITRTH